MRHMEGLVILMAGSNAVGWMIGCRLGFPTPLDGKVDIDSWFRRGQKADLGPLGLPDPAGWGK